MITKCRISRGKPLCPNQSCRQNTALSHIQTAHYRLCDYALYKCTIDNDIDIDRQTDRHMVIVIIYTVQSQRRAGNNTLSSINNTAINKTRAPFRFQQWRSQKFSTGGASICSIPFCPFPFSCPTKSAVQSKNVLTYHTT